MSCFLYKLWYYNIRNKIVTLKNLSNENKKGTSTKGRGYC